MRPILNRLPCGQSDPLWICSNADSCCIGNSLRSKRFCGFSEQRKTEERDFDNFAAQEMVDSVSSRCSGMSPRSPPESLSGGEHGLIPKQRLDTEPKEMGKSKKWSEGRGGEGITPFFRSHFSPGKIIKILFFGLFSALKTHRNACYAGYIGNCLK